jgi:hypothetical protein
MESKDLGTTPYNGEEKAAATAYDGAGGNTEDGAPTPPERAGLKESNAIGEAADMYGNVEDAENLGYVERG